MKRRSLREWIDTIDTALAIAVVAAFFGGCPEGQRIVREVGHLFVGKTNPDAGIVHVVNWPDPAPEERACGHYDDRASCALVAQGRSDVREPRQ
jgi:hypothetical protein